MKTELKNQKKQILPMSLWLDHLEDEIEPICHAEAMDDLDLLLKNSKSDRAMYESLLRVRTLIKKTDDVVLPESGDYYDQLHAKIMASIDDEISSGVGRPSQRSRFAWMQLAKNRIAKPQAMFGALGMTMMLAFAAFVGLSQKGSLGLTTDRHVAQVTREAHVNEHFERKLAAVDSHELQAAFARDMGAYQSEEDFLTEAAASRLKQISKRDADAVIRSLM